MDGGRGAGQVVDLVNFQQDGVHDVVADELKVGLVEQVQDVLLGAREKVVHADDLRTELARQAPVCPPGLSRACVACAQSARGGQAVVVWSRRRPLCLQCAVARSFG